MPLLLEDHVGDIVAKARAGLRLDAEEMASVAGVSSATYARFEERGPEAPGAEGIRLEDLATRLSLDPDRLREVAEGWAPSPVDLGRWRHLERLTTSGRDMAVHAYLIWDPETREAAVFDTGFYSDPILESLATHHLELKWIGITHSHGDHVAGLTELQHAWPQARIISRSHTAPNDQRVDLSWTDAIGSLEVSIRDTPGHAEDGATFVVSGWDGNAPDVAVVGDALFAGSMGGAPSRFEEAREHVRARILSLPDPTLVCPGHGPLTTVGEERRHNPFFSERPKSV